MFNTGLVFALISYLIKMRRKTPAFRYGDINRSPFRLHCFDCWWCATVRYQKVYREPEDCLVGVI